jgi:hypothetical protein
MKSTEAHQSQNSWRPSFWMIAALPGQVLFFFETVQLILLNKPAHPM